MPVSAEDFVRNYGPWALVTGASDGIGAEVARELGARGLNLILVARSKDRLEALADAVRGEHGVEAIAVAADLGREAGLRLVLETADDKEVGLYAGCAGFGTAGKFADNIVADELNMIDVNCRALAALAHPLATRMRDRGRGGIILMSSIVAFQGVSNSANYAATKAFVQTLAEGLHDELAPHGVDVLASAPGPVATGFGERADMKVSGAANPREVTLSTLAALGRNRTVRPGFQSKLLGYGLATLPRVVRSRIMGSIMMGMTKHRNA